MIKNNLSGRGAQVAKGAVCKTVIHRFESGPRLQPSLWKRFARELLEISMKDNIHPKNGYAKIECACGAVIETRSTRGSFKIDICSKCHPFYTGKQKLIDSAGRVERFNRKYGRV